MARMIIKISLKYINENSAQNKAKLRPLYHHTIETFLPPFLGRGIFSSSKCGPLNELSLRPLYVLDHHVRDFHFLSLKIRKQFSKVTQLERSLNSKHCKE